MSKKLLILSGVIGLFGSLGNSQTITVTTHISACPASYASNRSTTTIQSTATVIPTPLNDNALNSGTPFVINVYGDAPGQPSKRQDGGAQWLTANGSVTTSYKNATHYQIKNGQLLTASGSVVSANTSDLDQPLAAYSPPKSVTTTFSFTNGTLGWTNPDFGLSLVYFFVQYIPPASLPVVNAKFAGTMSSQEQAGSVVLYAQPVPSSSATTSSTMNAGSMVASSMPAGYSYMPPLSAAASSGPQGYSEVPGSSMNKASSMAPASSMPQGYSMGPGSSMAAASSMPQGYSMAQASSVPPASTMPQAYTMASMSSMAAGSSIAQAMSSKASSVVQGISSSVASSSPAAMSSSLPAAYPSYQGMSASRSSPASQHSSYTPPVASSAPNAYSMAMSSSPAPASSTSQRTSSSSASASASSTPSNLTPDGSCGGTNGYTCIGAYSGSCCSPYGYCGTGSGYCDTGCQPAFGTCNAQNASSSLSTTSSLSSVQGGPGPVVAASMTSSSMIMASSSVPAGYAAASSAAVSSSISSSNSAQSTAYVSTPASCPADNGMIVQDSNGIQYMLGCGYDANPDSYTTGSASNSFNDCFLVCDYHPGCTGFAYSGGGNGVGEGICYLKQGTVTFKTGDQFLVSAYQLGSGSGSGSSGSAALSSSSGASAAGSMASSSASSMASGGLTAYNGAAGSSSMGMAASSSAMATTMTSSTSSASAIATNQCPYLDGKIFTDNLGYQYNISCDSDSQGGAFTSFAVNGNGLEGCTEACDNSTAGCTALVYAPDATWTKGNCYLKQSVGSIYHPTDTTSILVGRLLPGGPVSITHTPASSTRVPSTSSVNTGPPTPTPCNFGDSPGTDEDDNFCEIDLPFTMYMYSDSGTATFATTNGVLSLNEGTTAYDGGQLPDDNLPPSSACPLFDDLYYYASQPNEGIFYTINTQQTTVTYLYNLSRGGTDEFYSFTVFYDSGNPGVFVYNYTDVADDVQNYGQSASVGIQGTGSSGDAVAIQYSYDQAVIMPGLTITCDTIQGKCTGSAGTVVTGSTS